jgi:hypothetical protein
VTRGSDLSTFAVLLAHAANQGQVQQQGRLLIALLVQCCQGILPADHFVESIQLLRDYGVNFADQQWWPASFSDSIRAALPAVAAQSSQPVSPLVFACACRNSAALEGFLAAVPSQEQRRSLINSPDPSGFMPLVVAAASGAAQCCVVLAKHGALLMASDATPQRSWPLWAAAEAGKEGNTAGRFLLR